MASTERSRAYPVLPLEDSRRLIGEILNGLGDGTFSREVIGEALGYSNARGGSGARKIAALSQYGFLRRRAGLYSPTLLAREVVEAPSAEQTPNGALRRALRQPPLFAALLDRYLPQGRVPAQLAGVLCRDYGITQKASQLAADVFHRSARYAGVLNREGAFLPTQEAKLRTTADPVESQVPETEPEPPAEPVNAEDLGPASEQRFEFVLTQGQVAKLVLPLRLCRRDLDIIRRQIDFLEYQVSEEISA